MGYWQQVQRVAGMGGHYRWVLAGIVIFTFALASLTPEARLRLRAGVFLVAASFAALLICAALLQNGLEMTTAGVRYIHFASQLLLSIAIINIAGVLLFRVVLTRIGLEPAPILRDTLLGLSYVIVALTLLARHGVDLSGIVATSEVVTAVVGFSLQDTLGNIMGGMAIQMEQSIGVGDWVRIGELEGLVREIRWRQTSIETRNWDTVVIPNSVLMKSQVTVLGRRHGFPKLHRMWVNFNIDFRHAPVDVIDAVERALQAEEIPNVATNPPPNCILREFKESYGQYAVRYWLSDFAKDDLTSSEVRTRILVALKRAGINPSIPAQTLFMTMESEGRIQRKQRAELDRRCAALKNVTLFDPLTDPERHELADKVSVAPFRSGEVITRQGNEAHYLYIIIKGEADVQLTVNSHTKSVARLHVNDVFGEMGLLTGEPRLATVTALTDTICYRLDKEAFNDTLHRRPEIAEAISHLLAKRKIELDALKQGMSKAATQDNLGQVQGELLHRIRKFFTLS